MLKEYLKSYRYKKNITQKEMAVMLNTSQSYYSQIESGALKPGYTFCKRLAKVLNVEEEFIKGLL